MRPRHARLSGPDLLEQHHDPPFVTKPVDFAELAGVLHDLLGLLPQTHRAALDEAAAA